MMIHACPIARVSAIMELWWSFKNQQIHLETKQMLKEQWLSASVQKRKMKKNVQTLKYSSHKVGGVVQAEGVKQSILVSTFDLTCHPNYHHRNRNPVNTRAVWFCPSFDQDVN